MNKNLALAVSILLASVYTGTFAASNGAQKQVELRGAVTDETGAVMPAVSVRLT